MSQTQSTKPRIRDWVIVAALIPVLAVFAIADEVVTRYRRQAVK